MAKISKETIADWTARADAYLGQRNLSRGDIITGKDAWIVAHNTGAAREAYQDATVLDAHIQTALESIFPNAEFLDKKIY